MIKVEYAASTGAPRVLIQANPSWISGPRLPRPCGSRHWRAGATTGWTTSTFVHIETSAPYTPWPSGRYWSLKDGGDIIKNFSIVVHHNADDWGSGESEVTEAKSFDVITVGINNLPPDVKLSIMNPYTCDIDAEIADQIVQTGLFGSPVYG